MPEQEPYIFLAPQGACEELAAAIEAATGREHPVLAPGQRSGPALKRELDELLMAPRPDRGLEALRRSGLLPEILPEVAALVGFGEGIRHKDVWEHTKKVVRQSRCRLVLRWAALLHDIGKVPTRRFESDGQVTFIGHPEAGARMFRKIARRLAFPSEQAALVRFLIAEHLRASAYQHDWTDSAVRRFAREAGDSLEDLLDLARADMTSKYEEKVRRGLALIDSLASRVAQIQAEDSKPAALPKGLGNAILARYPHRPGRWLGALMQRLCEEVEAGNLGLQAQAEHYLEAIDAHPAWLEAALSEDPHK
ncbi:MAG: HD domain-containing protein [Myxococcota bacterium]|jgi:poly(A) polymerase|nr:HD domain-containing protein [Myxococcota bacterium]